ncbi:hypothetical protein [Aeromicrobium wangtongii]|uniref:DUF3618 domain-containing protein n=1 Tax=Aeromicrobium wangtongii TaxID=2969247 RepID=A0ABY5MA53_9ACTN|nr:hypothetical protein [Aeromicrobium wangtongii]MCD9199517.1 hypothetical protein [Aeromicrobium wangtongii]UUP13870.1 hypothetical protein NQV15_00745 [Aeromicrobium wangtongii]
MLRSSKKSTTLRDQITEQIGDLASQTDELRKQVIEHAPAVRDQIAEQTVELRKQVADRAPAVRDQIVAALPDKDQLLDLRDDLFERLPENVQERLPEQVKPKRRTRLRKVAAIGVLTGAGAAAFAIMQRRGSSPAPYVAPTPPATPPAPPAATAPPTVAPEPGATAAPDAAH